MKKEVLDRINLAIREEKGMEVTIQSTMKDANLDSLGMVGLLIQLDNYYRILKDDDDLNNLEDYVNMTVVEMVNLCVVSSLKE
jgi:acyl carrier protein